MSWPGQAAAAAVRSDAAVPAGMAPRAVLWSPHRSDEVLVAGSGIRLYRVRGRKFTHQPLDDPPTKPPRADVAPAGGAAAAAADDGEAAAAAAAGASVGEGALDPLELLAANCHETLLRSTVVDWYPDDTQGNVIAVGHASGMVTITNVDGSVSLGAGLANRRDYTPKVSRPCSEIAFNPLAPSKLAVGLGKSSKEPSLLVWDISAKTVTLDSKRRPGAGADTGPVNRSTKQPTGYARTVGPIELLTPGDQVPSLKWMPGDTNTLIAGVGNKWLRLFDVRTKTNHSVGTARGAYCIATDPNSPKTFATFSQTDHAIKIWDMRQFSEPVYTLMAGRSEFVIRMQWCPTRPGLLGALFEGDEVVQLYDTRHTHSTELEAWANKPISNRTSARQNPSGGALAGFDWHPTIRNRLMTISTNGALGLSTAPEPVCATFSASGTLCCGSVGELEFVRAVEPTALEQPAPAGEGEALPTVDKQEDISSVMRRRALAGYYGTSIEHNMGVCVREPEVQSAWRWLSATDGRASFGVRGALDGGGPADVARELQQSFGRNQGFAKETGKLEIPIHDSATRRAAALALCGWVGVDEDAALDGRLHCFEADGEFERAAALAVFHQDLPRAVKALTAGSEQRGKEHAGRLLSAAISISGYSPTAHKMAGRQHHVPLGGAASADESLWRDTCRRLIPDLPDPTIRAALTFLTTQDKSFGAIVDDESLELSDRLGFAFRYLSDDRLLEFLNAQSKRALEGGRLEGLLVEGFSARGLDILEAYVDRTADVQTAAALTASAISADPVSMQGLSAEPRVERWLEAYRDLLDQWQLFIERAKFDVDRLQSQSGKANATQVYVRCTFCNSSVIPSKLSRGNVASRMRPAAARNPSRRTTMACSSCRRPLPRCSVCLLHLGTATKGTTGVATKSSSAARVAAEGGGKIQRLGWWISWCQRCRHGGHAEHLESWFREHETCPVTGCNCRCNMSHYEAEHAPAH
mmetsp:Transcript_3921/g.12256  ORF Transcript_3921/g.12256 Transcript_3921/m.12256 type:complete len:981 (+) Transcript_3921:44-2986(+)